MLHIHFLSIIKLESVEMVVTCTEERWVIYIGQKNVVAQAAREEKTVEGVTEDKEVVGGKVKEATNRMKRGCCTPC